MCESLFPSAWRNPGTSFGTDWFSHSSMSRTTSGSAFSWMVRAAVVCGQ